jgi:hypothetical protein
MLGACVGQVHLQPLTTAARELARYTSKLDLVGVHEVRWGKGGPVSARILYIFFIVKHTKIINWEQDFLHYRIVSAEKTAGFMFINHQQSTYF